MEQLSLSMPKWVLISLTETRILFWSSVFMLGEEGLEASVVIWKGPFLMGQSYYLN